MADDKPMKTVNEDEKQGTVKEEKQATVKEEKQAIASERIFQQVPLYLCIYMVINNNLSMLMNISPG
jgi:hypothetical protein